MIKNFKKMTAVILAGVLALGVSSCSNPLSSKDGNVTLKWVMSGPGELVDSQKVWAKFNEELQNYLPGVTVQFEVYPAGDYKQKFMLMQTVGDKIDIANVYKLNWGDELRKGTFADIDELVKTHGQDMYKAIPEFVWDYMKYNGKIYAVPSYQQLCNGNALFFPKEISDQYLDKEALVTALKNNDTVTGEVLDVIENYLAATKDAGKIGYGLDHWVDISGKGFERIVDYYAIRSNDAEHKVELLFETDEIKEYYARKAEWYKKGYIREDSLSAKDSQNGKENGTVIWQATSGYKTAEVLSEKYGMPIESIELNQSGEYLIPMQNNAMGNAIMSSSENKETAIKLLNLINSEQGKDLYNLLVYGIEGDHWTKTGEDKIKTEYSGQVTSNDRYGLFKWIVGNTKFAYDTQTDMDGFKTWVFEEVNNSTNYSDLLGFIPDTTKIATQLAQVLAVKGEYFSGLMSGALPNEEEVYNEFIDKLNKAGNQEIKAELQRQVDEFLAQKK